MSNNFLWNPDVKENGKEFRQETFHKCVLDVGPAPFELVEKYAW